MRVMVRDKVAKNMDYHQRQADYYEKLLEEGDQPRNGEGISRPQDRSVTDAKAKQREGYETLAKMHGDAAQQLRDLLNSAPSAQPAIQQAARDPNRVLRDHSLRRLQPAPDRRTRTLH